VKPQNLPNNDAAADALRKAQERLGRDRIDATRGPKFDRPKFDQPKLEKPKFANPDGRRDALDRVIRPDKTTHELPGADKFSKERPPGTPGKFDRLPQNAREALDKANLPRDLKLGGGKTPTDVRKNLGLDPKKFDGRHRDPTDFDRDRMSEHKQEQGPSRYGDPSKRDRYDLLHHRIKNDGKEHNHRVDAATAAKWSKQNWLDKSDRSHYDKLIRNTKFDKYHLDRQYQLHDHGDVARRLDMRQNFVNQGGWQHRHIGHVSSQYRNHCSYRNYWGPSWYPRRCWYPTWNNWVSWSWGFHCNPWYDPRPYFCRPAIYDPCQRWVFWQYPVWQPLPVVAGGTWVDVPQVMVNEGFDVRLLAVRFVDPGHLDQRLGQRYRVWLRNDSNRNIDRPCNVVLMGTNDLIPGDRRLEVGQRVPSIAAGQTLAIDMRLPIAPDGAGEPMPFEKLHALVDANRELNDVAMTNNGAVLDRGDVMPVDPAAFNMDADVATAGQVITIAGEGLGPEPGQILLQVGNETYQPEILGWYDLGVQVRLPVVNAAGMSDGDLVVVRGDGAATNPLAIQIAGAGGGREF
jgi:hypothetical protein